MSTANVNSLEALTEFKVQLIDFKAKIDDALTMLEQEILRAIDWLERDRPYYWNNQIRTTYDIIGEARTNYEACRTRVVAGHRSMCLEEKKALEMAKHRLKVCQDKIEISKKWFINVRHEADEFRGRMSQLRRCIDHDIPKTIALLEGMILSLEAYVEMTSSSSDNVVTEDE